MSGDDPKRPDEESTVFVPSEPPVKPADVEAAQHAAAAPGKIEIGSVLNHIYRVTRFIARGGMGEVYEGVNVNSDERVAIKVILPNLAADPKVQAMFRKEAKTLTTLSHPALVQYRVMAQEPILNLLYIVTEYVDGPPLSEKLTEIEATPEKLRGLIRRLSEGLAAAHELGAVHRDLSPDNILLAGGRIDRAKVIDFGIAKDLDPGGGTIIGDGFAGKLAYVAPEQFGDFDRSIGPWTDVYSLGLVMLAAAEGKPVDMGSTLVEAIDRRRQGPDLSSVPDDLKPLFDRMLEPDPQQRMRSMGEVLAWLAASEGPEGRTVFMPSRPVQDRTLIRPGKALPPPPVHHGVWPPARPMLIGAGAVAALAVAIGAVWSVTHKHGDAAGTHPPSAADADLARRAVTFAMKKMDCTWLELDRVTPGGKGLALSFTGVAGSPVSAEAAIKKAVTDAGARVASVSMDQVGAVDPSTCDALDALRVFRVPTSQAEGRLATAQHVLVMSNQVEHDDEHPGQMKTVLAARAGVELRIRNPSLNFALLGITSSGKIDMLIPDRATFEKILPAGKAAGQFTDLGDDSWRLNVDIDRSGWSGFILIAGKPPFDEAMLTTGASERDADWRKKLVSAAEKGEWTADMAWLEAKPPERR